MKRLICIILVTVLGLISFSGCKADKDKTPLVIKEDNKNLHIEILKRGYGKDWLVAIADAYKKAHPGVNITITDTPLIGKLDQSLRSGPSQNQTDLYFSNNSSQIFKMIADGNTIVDGYDPILEDLTDVYNSTIDGENQTVAKKMLPEFEKYYNQDGKYYTMPWAFGLDGLLYNVDFFKENNFKMPRTTDELIELCNKIKAINKEGFIYSGTVNYWHFLHEVWWAQYNGIEDYKSFFDGKVNNKLSPEIYLQDGRLFSLKVLDTLLSPQNKYCNPSVGAISFIDAQVSFLLGKQAMMPNGDWIEIEMSSNKQLSKAKIAFMKTPIISELGKKLGITDEQLRQAIDFVDGKTTIAPSTIPENKIGEIRTSRNLISTIGPEHIIYMPVYSNAKTLAKDFLKFMASDKGLEIYAKSTKGSILPYTYDYSKNVDLYNSFSDFQKTKIEILKNSTPVFERFNSPLFFRGGLKSYSINNGSVEASLGGKGTDKKTAEQIFQYEYDHVKGSKWSDILTLAGLN